MALIGSINAQGELQGQINGARYITGVITNASAVGGEVVGMRGLQGEKGDTGDTGATGADGQDGFSPSASVSKVDNVATITITDKDGTTTAEVYDGSGGGDVTDVTVDGTSIVDSDGVAELETATQLRNGLMTALDKQKLDGIASGAEVNVQSDWNEADNTADDYIKNKPTIPTKVSDLTNDSGFLTTETDPVFTASDAYGITSTDINNWDGKQDALVSGTNIKTINNESLLGSGDITVAAGGTSTPTADEVSEFDSDAHMNSTDMTTGSGSELEDFIDGLNVSGGGIVSFTKGSTNTTGSTFLLPNNYRGMFWVLTSSANYCGEYILFTTGGGVVGTKAIAAASNVTITTSTNNSIKITTSAGTAEVLFVNVQGKATI